MQYTRTVTRTGSELPHWFRVQRKVSFVKLHDVLDPSIDRTNGRTGKWGQILSRLPYGLINGIRSTLRWLLLNLKVQIKAFIRCRMCSSIELKLAVSSSLFITVDRFQQSLALFLELLSYLLVYPTLACV
jgi:hypothetical protein